MVMMVAMMVVMMRLRLCGNNSARQNDECNGSKK
jgi:hypothetical protein